MLEGSTAGFMPKVPISILNWNGRKNGIRCLESVKRITYPSYEVFVVDNDPCADDVKMLKEKFGD